MNASDFEMSRHGSAASNPRLGQKLVAVHTVLNGGSSRVSMLTWTISFLVASPLCRIAQGYGFAMATSDLIVSTDRVGPFCLISRI